MILRIVLYLVIAMGSVGCASKKNVSYLRHIEPLAKIEVLACEKFKQDFEIQLNGNYILVQSKKSLSLPDMSYFVYSVKDKHIIIEDSLKQGVINWSDKFSIIASEKDEYLNTETRTYKFNLKKRKYSFL